MSIPLRAEDGQLTAPDSLDIGSSSPVSPPSTDTPGAADAPLVDAAFYTLTATILGATVGVGLYTHLIGWPLVALPALSQIRLLPSATTPLLQQLVAHAATFCWFTHLRALQYVPNWTKRYNIFVDFAFGVGGLLLAPSVFSLKYCLMHTGFLVMWLLDYRYYLGLFAVRKCLGSALMHRVWCTLYFLATLFEISVQTFFVLRTALLPPLLVAGMG